MLNESLADLMAEPKKKNYPPNRKGPTRRGGIIDGYHGYCSSDRCCKTICYTSTAGAKKYRKDVAWRIKDVPKGTKQCPDCGMYLYWKQL